MWIYAWNSYPNIVEKFPSGIYVAERVSECEIDFLLSELILSTGFTDIRFTLLVVNNEFNIIFYNLCPKMIRAHLSNPVTKKQHEGQKKCKKRKCVE